MLKWPLHGLPRPRSLPPPAPDRLASPLDYRRPVVCELVAARRSGRGVLEGVRGVLVLCRGSRLTVFAEFQNDD